MPTSTRHNDNDPPPLHLSALSTFLSTYKLDPQKDDPHFALALQIIHNLRHQHNWTALRLHTHAYLSSKQAQVSKEKEEGDVKAAEEGEKQGDVVPLPRPLVSGLPPHRVYVHPDDQIEELKKKKQTQTQKSKSRGSSGGNQTGDHNEEDSDEVGEVEREWVLPTHIREKWSLRRMAQVFDSVVDGEEEPNEEDGVVVEDEDKSPGLDGHAAKEIASSKGQGREGKGRGKRRRRGGKRMLLATLDDDSTVAYYVVHDGLVKPRQN